MVQLEQGRGHKKIGFNRTQSVTIIYKQTGQSLGYTRIKIGIHHKLKTLLYCIDSLDTAYNLF